MRLLFVMDPLDRIQVKGDSTYMLMREATRRGYHCAMCTPGDLYVLAAETCATVTPLTTHAEAPHFRTEAPRDARLGDFDVVWMRKDPPFDMSYIFACSLLDHVPRTTLVVNDPVAIRVHNEKLATLHFPDLVAPSLVTRDIPRARAFAADAPGKVVLKPWDGNGGRGVLVTEAHDPNLSSMLEILTGEGRNSIIVQHYLPEIKDGDKRIILVDGEPMGWFARVPVQGDHRGNMHAGARVEAVELSDRDREICARIGPMLRENGLVFVGIDVIGRALTEINVTSPTGIQEVARLQGRHLEVHITDAVQARFEARLAGQETP